MKQPICIYARYPIINMIKQNQMIFRGGILMQIIQPDDENKKEIIKLEQDCEDLCQKLVQKFQHEFIKKGQHIVIELVRTTKGRALKKHDVFENDNESYIEIGLEYSGEYYPNGYIPIWKFKTEWFQKIGYVTRRDTDQLEKIISSIVMEILNENDGK